MNLLLKKDTTYYMTLESLILAVKEQGLSKDQLELYHDQMSELYAQMQIEMAELEKEEAVFMAKENGTVAAKKVEWRATHSGQRLIVLKRYSVATKEMINSLKSRTYRLIY